MSAIALSKDRSQDASIKRSTIGLITPDSQALKKMETRFSPEPAGYLLSRFGLLVLLAGLLLAAWYGQVIMVVLLSLVLSAAGASKNMPSGVHRRLDF